MKNQLANFNKFQIPNYKGRVLKMFREAFHRDIKSVGGALMRVFAETGVLYESKVAIVAKSRDDMRHKIKDDKDLVKL